MRRSPDLRQDVWPEAALDPDAHTVRLTTTGQFAYIDVTEHLRRALACGNRTPTWLLRRGNRDGMRPRIMTREAPAALAECGMAVPSEHVEMDPDRTLPAHHP